MNKDVLYAAALKKLVDDVEQKIENDVPGWLDRNPCFEVDDLEEDGRRTFRYPSTTPDDARGFLSEDFVDACEEAGIGDFGEFLIYLIYGEPMKENNSFSSLIERTKNEGNN